jgi:hypothetical protein
MSLQNYPSGMRHYNARGRDLLQDHERFVTRVEGKRAPPSIGGALQKQAGRMSEA